MTFIDILNTWLGTYSPVFYSVDGVDYIPSGFAGVDIAYVVRAVVLCIALYSTFKIIGGVICRK